MTRRVWRRQEISALVAGKVRQHGYTTPADLPVDPFKIAAAEQLHVELRPLLGLGGYLIKSGLLTTVMLDKLQPLRNTFSMAHELIHFWCHPDGVYHESGASKGLYEIQANHGAAELLMPASWVRLMAAELGADPLRLAQAFGVSRQAMEIRMEELDLAKNKRGELGR